MYIDDNDKIIGMEEASFSYEYNDEKLIPIDNIEKVLYKENQILN